jgi:hypothetical protein
MTPMAFKSFICTDLCFLGVEAWQCAEGINVVPRMVDQVQNFDVCSVVNNRQTGAMTLQVKMPRYKYDDDNVNLVKFVKGNKNFVLMDFQKTASILFYVNVRYVYVHYNNLHNDDEVIDHMRGGVKTIH